MNEFLEVFVQESRELASQASEDLLALERHTGDRGRLDSAFRAFHTMKGGAGIVEFEPMARALHGIEELLARARSGDTPVNAALIGNCLSALDLVHAWLNAIQAQDALPANAAPEADRFLRRLQGGNRAVAARQPGVGNLGLAHDLLRQQMLILADEKGANRAGRFAAAIHAATNILRALGRPEEAEQLVAIAASCEQTGDIRALRAMLANAIDAQTTPERNAGPAAPEIEAVRTLRVDIGRIDFIVKLAGELTVAKNALAHAVTLAREGATGEALFPVLKGHQTILARLVEELQQSVLGLRVLPLRQVFQRFPRMVRDLAESLDKPVQFTMAGEETDADKAIVDNLAEPLLHVLRNALDHGVEQREDRLGAGKTEMATITLSARREAEHVVIEVADDGRGIDPAQVRRVALQRGIRDESELTALTDQQTIELIFEPGFSTAAQVSNLSGRGVGMDAVRSVIRKLGGTVHIESEVGAGTTVRFAVPFSVLVTPVMTIEVAGQLYGIPLERVVQTQRLKREQIVPLGTAKACVIRGRTIPILQGSDLLSCTEAPSDQREYEAVVVEIGGQWIAVLVDRAGEHLQVMLNPPGGLLAVTRGISGTALLGDGRVLVVLDLPDLIDTA
ncbi:MAG TPA: chemotaxis protein CheA [Micropepsaceae bacterium]|nr:chemotaxis protein CheA [Micropepsaceae bacterium]